MSEKKPKIKRELIHLERVDKIDPDKFADKMGDAVVDLMNKELKRRGEAPLK